MNRMAYYELVSDMIIRIATDGGDAVPPIFRFQQRVCDGNINRRGPHKRLIIQTYKSSGQFILRGQKLTQKYLGLY